MLNKHIWQLEILFLCGLIVNLFIEKKLYLKILFIILLTLFFFKEKNEFILIKSKYLYFGYGLIGMLVLSLLLNYVTHIYFITFSICLVVLYFYLYKIIFRKTIGKVTKVKNNQIYFKIIDPFYKSKKEFNLFSRKKIIKEDTILVEQSKFLIKKPIKILEVVKNND